MSEGQLLSRLIPTGEGGMFEYLISEFVRLYENGGDFLFDEIDAADSNTLLVLNAALANGHLAVSNRPGNPVAKKHPDFVCIAAANTYGTGADRQYVGRNQRDESTLDRFRIGQIEMDYDPDVEKVLCPDDELRNLLQGIRQMARAAKIRRIVSTRFLRDGNTMKRAGMSNEQIVSRLVVGWTRDELAKVGR
jgi:MoxR-like ATPase